jgi:hypothetical protein
MSVYSGFATRQLECFYDQLVNKALQLLSSKLLSFYNGCKLLNNVYIILELADERLFTKKMLKIHRTLQKLEEQKYAEPIQSSPIEQLITYLNKNKQVSSSNSTIMMTTSMISSMPLGE